MKGMKKLLCVLLAGAMIMGLCACGKTGSGKSRKDDDDDDRGSDRRTERTEDEEETTETTLDLEAYWEDEYLVNNLIQKLASR